MPYHTKFKCKRCGFCCTLLPRVTEADIRRIAKAGYGRDYFLERGMQGSLRMRMPRGKCIFLKKWRGRKYRCAIYESRPKVCRIYPSYDKNAVECSGKVT
jgi:Fe-S-cluster containining protein